MKNFLQPILALRFLLTASPMLAQTKNTSCAIRFGIVHLDQRLPTCGIPGMTKHQSDWHRKSGLKKFPSLCEDEAKPDYLILWTAEDASSVVGSSDGRMVPSLPCRERRCGTTLLLVTCVILKASCVFRSFALATRSFWNIVALVLPQSID